LKCLSLTLIDINVFRAGAGQFLSFPVLMGPSLLPVSVSRHNFVSSLPM
jgi:hypothetical protein